MKNFYGIFLVLGMAFILPGNSSAQEFPWPDLGTSKVLEPGAPGLINQTIMGDTTETGERLFNHYVLKRGQTYLYTARIENDGWPLMVTAEEGTGELPIIKPLGPAAGQEEAERPFHATGNLYLQDLTLVGWDQGGNYTDNATVRLNADGITVVIKNVNFDFNRQNSIRINAQDCQLYVENSVFGNQGVSQRLFQGFAVAFRGNWTPIVHLRNNTIYNMHNEVINNGSPARYEKLILENNTIVNTGTGGAYFGRPNHLIVRNNLWVNVGIMGDGFLGDRDGFAVPHYYLSIDSLFSEDEVPVLIEPNVEFEHNHFYLDPAVAALLPDSSDKSTETLFHPYLADLAGEDNLIFDEAFTFTNFPATVSEYQAYITDFYNFAEIPAQMPQFDTDFRTFDFSYSTSHPAYTGAHDGMPLGDRNWFGIVGVDSRKFEEFNVFPNPVEEFFRVDLNQDQKLTHVVITNLLGQEVRTVSNPGTSSFTVNTSGLRSGVYIVKFYDQEQLKGANKILKK